MLAVLPGRLLLKRGIVSEVKDAKMQVQPAGIDLTVGNIASFITGPSFLVDSIRPSETREATLHGTAYSLRSGSYVLTFAERIEMPADCCGLVLPRSSLLRSGVAIHTALWDPGYKGRGKVLLTVLTAKGARMSLGARVAQLIVLKLSGRPHSAYSGQYQGEGLRTT